MLSLLTLSLLLMAAPVLAAAPDSLTFGPVKLVLSSDGRPDLYRGNDLLLRGIYVNLWHTGYKGDRLNLSGVEPRVALDWEGCTVSWEKEAEGIGRIGQTVWFDTRGCEITWEVDVTDEPEGPGEAGFWLPQNALGAGQAVPYRLTLWSGQEAQDELSWDLNFPEEQKNGVRSIAFQTAAGLLRVELGEWAYWMFQDQRAGEQTRGLYRFVAAFTQAAGPRRFAARVVWDEGAAPQFQPVDLRAAANMAFRDEVADDQQGGWTDQGSNDLASFPVGRGTFAGIPFDVIDPATNDGKSCVLLRGPARPFFPDAATVPVGCPARMLYFLQAAAWAGEKGTPVLDYVVRYEDGTQETIPVATGHGITDWWNPEATDVSLVGWRGTNGSGVGSVGVHVMGWRNPHPDRTIAALELRSANRAVPGVIGITTAQAEVPLVHGAILRRDTLPLPPLRATYTFGGPAHFLLAHNLGDARLEVQSQYLWWKLSRENSDLAVIDSAEFQDPWIEHIPRFLDAGGVVLVGRYPPLPKGLAEFLPVTLNADEPVDARDDPGFLTPTDPQHPAFSGIPWDEPHVTYPLAPTANYLNVTPKGGAEVLATWNGRVPALVVWPQRAGKVVFFNCDHFLLGGWASSWSSHEAYFWAKLLYYLLGHEDAARQLGLMAEARQVRQRLMDPLTEAMTRLENVAALEGYLSSESGRAEKQKGKEGAALEQRLSAIDAQIDAADSKLAAFEHLPEAAAEYRAAQQATEALRDDLQAVQEQLIPPSPAKRGKGRGWGSVGDLQRVEVRGGPPLDMGATHVQANAFAAHRADVWVLQMMLARLRESGWNLCDYHTADVYNTKADSDPTRPSPTDFDFSSFHCNLAAIREMGFRTVIGSVVSVPGYALGRYADVCNEAYYATGIPKMRNAAGEEVDGFNYFSDEALARRSVYLEEWAKALDKEVIGFEPQNEPGLPMSYGPDAVQKFQAFLQQKYGRIGALNAALHGDYADFAEVQPPRLEEVVAEGDSGPKRALWWEWLQFRQEWWGHVLAEQRAALRRGTDRPVVDRVSPISLRNCARDATRAEVHARHFDHLGTHVQRPWELDYSADYSWPKSLWLGEYYWTYYGGSYSGLRYRWHKDWMLPYVQTEVENFAAIGRNFWRAISRGVDQFRVYQTGMPTSAWGETWAGPMTVFWPDFSLRREAYALKWMPQEYQRFRGELEGSVPAADVALVEPVASKLHTEGSALAETAGDIFNDLEHLFNHLEALQVPTRQFPSTAKDWESVRLVIVPSGLYLERAVTDRLQAWVEAGGTLVATCPIGRYDEHSWPDGHLLRSLWGVTGAKRQRSGGELVLSPFNSPTHPLTHSPKLPVSNVGEAVWSFEVDERKATVLARYAAGGVAALRAEVGAGRAYLLGFPANWSMSAFDAVVLRPALAETITPFVVTDNPRLRLYLRQKGKARLLFVLNQMHTAPEQVTLTFRQPARITDLRLAVALPPTDHLTLHLRPGEGRVFKVEGR